MKKPKLAKQLALCAIVVVGASCAAEVPPDVPSWDLDVYPILRGSCGHCHGVTVNGMAQPLTRYDVCDSAAFSGKGLNVSPGATAGAILISMFVKPQAGGARMPPPPAAPLTDYERTVLERWGKNPKCNKQVPNRKPLLRVVQALARQGGRASVTLEVSDPDGDQVMGKAKLGGAEFVIQGSGRWPIEFNGAGANDRLTVSLFDGYEAVDFMP